MILFPGLSPRTMLRIVYPYIFSVIAIAAVVAGYIHFTDSTYSAVNRIEQNRALRTASGITSLNKDMSAFMFDSHRRDGAEYLELKPEFLESFGLSEFTLVYPLSGDSLEVVPFEEDSLAVVALNSVSPGMRYLNSGSEGSLLLYYPLVDSPWTNGIARMVFENLPGRDAVNRGRYNIYIISAIALVLIIMPGLFLRLADIRRQLEKNSFFQSDIEIETDSEKKTSDTDICPESLFDGFDFPPLFRLNRRGIVLFINSSAEKLIDITKDDIKGVKFHELPCFSAEDRNLIQYPEDEKPVEQSLGVIDSSGNSKEYSFRIELLSNTGFAVSVRSPRDNNKEELSGSPKPGTVSQNIEEPPGNLSLSEILRIKGLVNDCRMKFPEDPDIRGQLNTIYDILSGKQVKISSENIEKTGTIEIFSELNAVSEALNDVLPERVSIELDVPGFLPQVKCSRGDFTQMVKNMVFYSLESTKGSIRIKIEARDVPSPVSDSVFFVNCDRTVSRAVSISYTDGTRMPVVLKEALLDPETDLSGIQRDYGSHISSVAEILSSLDCHPVFTEGSTGTTLNILFQVSEGHLFDSSSANSIRRIDLDKIKLLICDSSRAVRESVSDILTMYGMDVTIAADLDRMNDKLAVLPADFLLLDFSILKESTDDLLSNIRIEFPDLEIILTVGSSETANSYPECFEGNCRILKKPYSLDELLNIIEISISSRLNVDNA